MAMTQHVMGADEAMEVYEGAVYRGLAHRIRCTCGKVIEVGPEPGLTAEEAQVRARHDWANHAQAS